MGGEAKKTWECTLKSGTVDYDLKNFITVDYDESLRSFL